MTPAVKRVKSPVLQGAQNEGKSYYFAQMIPDSSWFSDVISFKMSGKEKVESMMGMKILEFCEMAGVS